MPMIKKPRKAWSAWVVDHIKETNKCPGEVPAMGLSTEKMTHDEFLQTVGSGLHDADNCNHFMNERLGFPNEMTEGMVEVVGHKAAPITQDDIIKGKSKLDQGGPSTAIDRLKRQAHTYIDLIELRKGGKLYIPQQLLNFATFLKQFFEVKDNK